MTDIDALIAKAKVLAIDYVAQDLSTEYYHSSTAMALVNAIERETGIDNMGLPNNKRVEIAKELCERVINAYGLLKKSVSQYRKKEFDDAKSLLIPLMQNRARYIEDAGLGKEYPKPLIFSEGGIEAHMQG